jgi:hypothetical protein
MAQYKSRGGEIGPKAIYRARAMAFLGLNPLDPLLVEEFEHFIKSSGAATVPPPGWSSAPAGSGTTNSLTAARAGGWQRVSTGATGASTMEIFTRGTTLGPLALAKWYFATRFVFTTTPDANTVLLNCITNIASTKSIGLGFRGSLNAANFIVQYDGIYAGSSIDLGVPKDTAIHVIEAFGVGSTTLRACIDGGQIFSATMAAAPADNILGFDILAQNGGTLANQSEDVDWVYMLGQGS